ncbi:hypothetical protein BDP27DRAFT_1370178 [Rhodocollybia butyracea]|uniref:Uncharacterized protein n=1 Tax=Rhodocollybia butyracea TaxID=206335 RepID=A0A9P5PCH8_9AGAR|nr:hypothetical protein BDP27DRAFT_1370178 [Rhodocollybia butyracea]
MPEWQEIDHVLVKGFIINVALSSNAEYLAAAHGLGVDIWHLNGGMLGVTWAPQVPRMVLTYQGGLVNVVTIGERSAQCEGFLLCGQAGRAVYAVFLDNDLLVVAMGSFVEIRRFTEDLNGRRWERVGSLPKPPVDYVDECQSIHMLAKDYFLVTYKGGIVV